MIHVAAAGDIHFGPDAAGTLRPHLEHLGERADLLLLAGDLTRVGTAEEAKALAGELADIDIPMVAVLGNHDYQCDQADDVTAILEGIGVHVLEGTSVEIPVNGATVGVAGTKRCRIRRPGVPVARLHENKIDARHVGRRRRHVERTVEQPQRP